MSRGEVGVDDVGSDESGASGYDDAQGNDPFPRASRAAEFVAGGTAVPPFALVLFSAAAVLGTLAVTPGLPPDRRFVVEAGLLALGAFALSGACKPPQFRALLCVALVGAALNA